MRKQEQQIVKGALIGFGAMSLIDILLQWIEHLNRGEKFTWDSYDGSRTLKNGMVGGVVGAGVGYILYEFESSRDQHQSFNSDEYLEDILRSESLKGNSDLLNKALIFRDQLKVWMLNHVGEKLVSVPENAGSFTKRTANANSFDIDILLPFKRESFNSLEEMYNWTYDKLNKEFGRKAIVCMQSKAISILFEKDGFEIKFDIVPGREINNYKVDKKLNLYVNPKVFWKRGSSFKIDSSVQRNITVNKPEARRVIRLLKIYNQRNSLEIPSIIIEQSVVEAMSFSRFGIFRSNTDNLLNSMEYLAQKLNQETFIDHGNANNNLNSKMSLSSKFAASNLLRKDIEKIENTPHYIKEIFESFN